jgi:tetratricopeptide (TPR) repeat protein
MSPMGVLVSTSSLDMIQVFRSTARRAVAALACAVFSGVAVAEEADLPADCGKLRAGGQHGPFDYRKMTQADKDLVEDHHFHVEYKAYLRGEDRTRTDAGITPVASGFNYTLRAFPNHPMALSAMDRLAIRQGRDKPIGAGWTVRCYFERAIAFTPDDALVRALYAVFLSRRGEGEAAHVQAQRAVAEAPSDSNVWIQVASAYLNVGQYAKSREHAKRAYDLGYPLFGIRDKLRELGHWDEPSAPAPEKKEKN